MTDRRYGWISITNNNFPTSNSRKCSHYNFIDTEIESCIIINDPQGNPYVKSFNIEKKVENSMEFKPVPSISKEKQTIIEDKILSKEHSNHNKTEMPESHVIFKSNEDRTAIPQPELDIPQKTVFIGKIDKDFHEAISVISSEKMIAVCFEGIGSGRRGLLSLIAINAKDSIFIFDICSLGKLAFLNGLKEIFENSSLIKIFHDCREPSDALYHRYGVQLYNVFDTQIAEAFFFHKICQEIPKWAADLNYCLSTYLPVKRKDLHCCTLGDNYIGHDPTEWIWRPLAEELLDATIKHVRYLKQLGLKLMSELSGDEKHMHKVKELFKGIQIYLNFVKNCPEEQLVELPSYPHLLLSEVMHLME